MCFLIMHFLVSYQFLRLHKLSFKRKRFLSTYIWIRNLKPNWNICCSCVSNESKWGGVCLPHEGHTRANMDNRSRVKLGSWCSSCHPSKGLLSWSFTVNKSCHTSTRTTVAFILLHAHRLLYWKFTNSTF